MANLVDSSFFVGEINIPNKSKQEIAEKIDLFINRYEKELLQQMLGYELWYLYNADPSQDRFQKLVSGETYDDGTSNWRGLVYPISSTVKGSLIAYYIYWYWLKDSASWVAGIGTVRAQPNQATEISPAIKMVDTWNVFSEQFIEFCNYMNSSTDFPEWNPVCSLDFVNTNDFDI